VKKIPFIFCIILGISVLIIGLMIGIYLAERLSYKTSFKEDKKTENVNFSGGDNSSAKSETEFDCKITFQELKQEIEEKKDFVLLDVRKEEEYQKEHIIRAISMPVDIIDSEYHKLPKEKEIIVYCSSGCSSCSTSSNQAYNKLKKLGFSKVRKLEGSFSEWKDEGYPIE
jgi:rhodanese-related sulfurtransferase